MIPLITERDGFEVVRDRLPEILAMETAAQQAQATAQSLNPDDWKFKVYSERTTPWEMFLGATPDTTPVVNITYDGGTFDKGRSNLNVRQNTTSLFNVDCYGCDHARETGGGHIPGDEAAAFEVHRIGRIIRRILMHPDYRNLGLETTYCNTRWLRSREVFAPRNAGIPLNKVLGMRLQLEVNHNEEITLAEEPTLAGFNVKFRHEPDGEVIAELEY